MKKRMVATLLCLTMVAATLSACGKQEIGETKSSQSSENVSAEKSESASESDGASADDEMALDQFAGTEITVAVVSHANDLNSANYGERPLAKKIEEETGIKINWVPVEQGSAAEKTPTLLAGDMPDMLIGLVSSSMIAEDPDLFYDLSEEGLLETYAPDVYADYVEAGQPLWDVITEIDGSIRSLATGYQNSKNDEMGNIWFINKTWLEQVNMDMPTTTDELYDVLCAFRDNDMNGNGDTTDEIPLQFAQSHWSGRIGFLAGFFGIAGTGTGFWDLGMMIKDGVVTSTFDTQQYRDYLEYCHKLQTEGLLDVDGFSQTGEQMKNEYYAGLCGISSAWRLSTYVPEDMMENYEVLGPIQAYEDVEFVHTGGKGKVFAGNGCVISAATENVEACLWFWNYLTGDPMHMKEAWHGTEGVYWEVVDGKITDIPINDVVFPDGYNTDNYAPSFGILNCGTIGFLSNADYENYYSQVSTVPGDRGECVNKIYEYTLEEYLPTYRIEPEKMEERNALQSELATYIDSFSAKCIMEGFTDAQWEEHLDMLDQLGYYEWLDLTQKFYDREL